MSILDLPKHIKRRIVKQYINPKLFKEKIEYMALEGYLDFLRKTKWTDRGPNRFLAFACQYNLKDLAELAISKGANNIDLCLKYSIMYNYQELVDLLIVKDIKDLDRALLIAGYQNNIDCAKKIIQKGAKDLNNALLSACCRGYIDMAEFLISNGANNFYEAYHCSGTEEMKEFLLSKKLSIESKYR